jgi:hypothetical protein
MLTNFQKIRVLFYIFFIIVFLFLYPILNQAINKYIKTSDVSVNSDFVEDSEPYYELISLASKAFFKDEITQTWSLITNPQIKQANTSFVSLGDKSSLILKTLEGLELALAPDSMITVKKEESLIKIKMHYGCLGLRKKDFGHIPEDKKLILLGEEYLEEISPNMDSLGLDKSFCYSKETDKVSESQEDLFVKPYRFLTDFPKTEILRPCDDIIEVNDEGGRYANIELEFLSPPFIDKSVFVSTNNIFTDSVFSSTTKENQKLSLSLPKGKYYWRIKDNFNNLYSKVCEFEVVHHEDIIQKSPENDAVFSLDSSVEFSWDDNLSGKQNYTLFIEGKNTNNKYIKDEDILANNLEGENNFINTSLNSSSKKIKINNLDKTIAGAGTFYWKVESADKKNSPSRKFRILDKEGILIHYPKKDQLIDPEEKLFIVSWKAINSIKAYELKLFKSDLPKKPIYSNTVHDPFAIIELKEKGEYFLVLELLLDTGERISSDPLTFFVDNYEKLEVLSPSYASSSSVSTTWLKNLKWKPVNGAKFYRVFVNSDKAIETNLSQTYINVKSGLNITDIYAFCDNSKKPCAAISRHGFNISSVIEAPNPPIIRYPFNRHIFRGNYVDIELSRLKGVDGYKIEISKTINFEDKKELESSSPKFNFKSKKGLFYWKAYSFVDIDEEKIYSRPTETRILIVK